MRIGVYAGTFDPMTLGHVDLVQRALGLFDQVVIAVASSHSKQPVFDVAERVAMVQAVFADEPRVVAQAFDGLLVDFVRQVNAGWILRGLRAVSDFDYEFQLASMNDKLDSEVETLFFPANDAYAHISATIVRDIIRLGGDVSKFVPEEVGRFISKHNNA